jgi:uncharacterized membrane protein YbhN (UPF0104 family)
MHTRAARIGLRLVPLLLFAAFLWKEKPWTADLGAVPKLPLLAVPLLNFLLYMPAKALRWRLVLHAPPRFGAILAAMYEGALANVVLGFGSNDVVRAARLRAEAGAFVRDIGPTIAERATETAAMAILVIATTVFGPMPVGVGAAGLGILAGYVAFYLYAGRLGPWLEARRWRRLGHALASARAALGGWKLLGVLLFSLLGWATEVAQLHFVLGAFGLPADVATATLVLIGINAAVALPGPPANFGTFEAGAIGALFLCGITGPTAVAFTVAYHLLHVVPTATVATVVFFVRGASATAAPSTHT